MDAHEYLTAEWSKRFAKMFAEPSVFAALITYRRRTWRERLFSWPWRPWCPVEVDYTPPPPDEVRGDCRVVIRNYTVEDSMRPRSFFDPPPAIVREADGMQRRLVNPRIETMYMHKQPGSKWKRPEPVGPTEIQFDDGSEWLPEEE